MRVIVRPMVTRTIVQVDSDTIEIREKAIQGPEAVPPTIYVEHMANRENPHEVSLGQIILPEGNAGQWLKVSEDGTSLIPTDPPLTEVPPLPSYPDEFVKADNGDPLHGHLNEKISGHALMIDYAAHKLRLTGDVRQPPSNCYYGTDANGVIGWHPLPDALVISTSPEPEDPIEEEELRVAVGFSRLALP